MQKPKTLADTNPKLNTNKSAWMFYVCKFTTITVVIVVCTPVMYMYAPTLRISTGLKRVAGYSHVPPWKFHE